MPGAGRSSAVTLVSVWAVIGGVGLFDLEREELAEIGGRLADAGEVGGVVVERWTYWPQVEPRLAVRIGCDGVPGGLV